MRIYLASPIKNSSINRHLEQLILEKTDHSVFLPESMKLVEAPSNFNLIAEKCYTEIEAADLVLVTAPWGLG